MVSERQLKVERFEYPVMNEEFETGKSRYALAMAEGEETYLKLGGREGKTYLKLS